MPLVLMVSLVVTTLVAVVLYRQSAQSLMVQRQIDRYTGHHIAGGLREIINSWIAAVGAKPISDAIEPDGLGLTLVPESGVEVNVYFYEGQGAVLSDLNGMSDEMYQKGRAILAELARAAPRDLSRYTRRHGPIAISVNTAPEVVLEAAIRGTIGDAGKSLASEILSARGNSTLTSEQLSEILQKSSLDDETRGKVSQVLTAAPMVWTVVARTTSGGGQPPVVFRGTALVGRDRSAGGLQRTSQIIALERVREEQTGER